MNLGSILKRPGKLLLKFKFGIAGVSKFFLIKKIKYAIFFALRVENTTHVF
jgi:hypothetical protein